MYINDLVTIQHIGESKGFCGICALRVPFFSYNYNCKNKEVSNFREFMKKYNLKNVTMNEYQLQIIYNYHIYPSVSKIHSDTGFVNIHDGSQGGTHWTRFIIKDN